jgi:hypothetical protein
MQTALQITEEWHKPARYITDQKSSARSLRSDIQKQVSLILLSTRFIGTCFQGGGEGNTNA